MILYEEYIWHLHLSDITGIFDQQAENTENIILIRPWKNLIFFIKNVLNVRLYSFHMQTEILSAGY